MTILRANEHYDVVEVASGWRWGEIQALKCRTRGYRVNVIALHRAGDKSGAPRYCRARARMVKHWHATHR